MQSCSLTSRIACYTWTAKEIPHLFLPSAGSNTTWKSTPGISKRNPLHVQIGVSLTFMQIKVNIQPRFSMTKSNRKTNETNEKCSQEEVQYLVWYKVEGSGSESLEVGKVRRSVTTELNKVASIVVDGSLLQFHSESQIINHVKTKMLILHLMWLNTDYICSQNLLLPRKLYGDTS